MRVLGIDPGSNATGFGIVERKENEGDGNGGLVHVIHGTLRPPRSASLSERLHFLYAELADVVAQHQPDAAVVEQVFVATSPRSALVLGQARGVALAAAASAGVPVDEISAREVKQAVVGTGAASKRQVQQMVARLLTLDTRPSQDAADALAAAIVRARAGRIAALSRTLGPGRSRSRARTRKGRRSSLRVRPAP